MITLADYSLKQVGSNTFYISAGDTGPSFNELWNTQSTRVEKIYIPSKCVIYRNNFLTQEAGGTVNSDKAYWLPRFPVMSDCFLM